MEKPWLAQYPAGIPATVDCDAFSSLKDILEKSFTKYQQLPAYSNLGKTLTFAELDQLSRAFAAFLQHTGLQKGSRVAIMMPNLLQYPIAAFAVLRAGLVVVNVNPLYTARELHHQLQDSGAEAIIILENFAHTLAEVINKTKIKHVITTQIGDMLPTLKATVVNFVVKHIKKMVPPWQIANTISFKQALTTGRSAGFSEVILTHDDIAFLQYTGGTTGVAKGAVLSHGNMVANLQQLSAWMGNFIEEGKEIIITALPLYHIFSLTTNCLVFLKVGGHNVLITNPRDLPNFVKELGQYKFTCMTGVNTLFNALLKTPGFSQLDFSRLKFAFSGGMALQRSVAERWEQMTGSALIEGYGLTETSPVACSNPLNLKEFSGCIGVPIPSTEATLRDDEGRDVDQGDVGELHIRGPQVMQCYWQRPEETATVIDAQGWLATGDIAIMDERGYFRIVDRKKDMILVSGFNVYPNEIEDVIALHDKVSEVAAIGVPDERSGEIVKVFIVANDKSLTAEDVIQHCKQHLTGYKVPKKVEFRDDLPKTNVGKILRRALKKE